MVQETGYPIKILSNLLVVGTIIEAKGNSDNAEKLDPKFVTGLTDAEGSFSIKISKVNLGIFLLAKKKKNTTRILYWYTYS